MDWKKVFAILEKAALEDDKLPSVSQIALDTKSDPFRVLVSTMISLRTKDDVTYQASERLFAAASDPEGLLALPEERIALLIRPAGFFRTKAKHLRETAAILLRDHDGGVPSSLEELLKLPGVGRKTANLVLNLGFGIPAVCVDTHVHRISNRLGWASTKTPEETEQALMKTLPRKYWIPVNGLLVAYGKKICTPQSPRCSICGLASPCPKIGVGRSR